MNDLFAAATPVPSSYIGVGGWVYAPWRNNFYPAGWVQRRELEFASRQLTSIEINSTYYGTQTPATYARWAEQTPTDFVFSAKAPQRITSARKLTSTGSQIEDFIGGISALSNRLGPLVWQFDAGYRIDPEEFSSFLQLLPDTVGGRRLRHAVEIRDRRFLDASLVTLLRQRGVALVYTDSPEYPNATDLTADFCYARLMRSDAAQATGYPTAELQQWAARVQRWRDGHDLAELPHVSDANAEQAPRTVYLYFISAAKERNPAAAMALLSELGIR
jgi:uncharacterized protein YecE (DUF72 family)